MTRRIAAFAATLAFTTTLTLAAGELPDRSPRQGRTGFNSKMWQELNLTAEQQRLIAEIRANTRAQMKDIHDNARESMRERREARRANDTAALDRLKAERAATREKMRELRRSEEEQILALLTAEQKALYEKHKGERGRRGPRRGRG